MANNRYDYCPRCDANTDFDNIEPGVWECYNCGYIIDENPDCNNEKE